MAKYTENNTYKIGKHHSKLYGASPAIRIIGKFLPKLGWNIGDHVRAVISMDKIVITKVKGDK